MWTPKGNWFRFFQSLKKQKKRELQFIIKWDEPLRSSEPNSSDLTYSTSSLQSVPLTMLIVATCETVSFDFWMILGLKILKRNTLNVRLSHPRPTRGLRKCAASHPVEHAPCVMASWTSIWQIWRHFWWRFPKIGLPLINSDFPTIRRASPVSVISPNMLCRHDWKQEPAYQPKSTQLPFPRRVTSFLWCRWAKTSLRNSDMRSSERMAYGEGLKLKHPQFDMEITQDIDHINHWEVS